jgi:glyoxylate reductase
MKPVLYITRSLPGADLARLEPWFEIRGGGEAPATHEVVVRDGHDATVLATTYADRVDEALLARLPRLRHVASYGVGVNHLDLDACRRRRLLVTNTPGVVTVATADLTLALLLAAARRVVEADGVVRRGGWTGVDPGWMLGTEVSGKTLGIVGFGRIGQAVARRAAGFDLRILYAHPRDEDFPGARRVPLDALLAESDFVTLHVPLRPDTANLLDRRRIGLLKPGAVVVNAARGGVLDEDALAEALREGRVGAAGLDVFEGEPRVRESLLRLDNVVLTPHLGSGTRETRAAMSRMVIDEIERVARGEPPRHPVP